LSEEMRWADFEAAQPKLAEMGREKLARPGVVLVGTIRRDGSPRISPVEPMLWRGDLWLSMLWGSLKARDLERDSRVLVHSIVTGPAGEAGEYKVRGRAAGELDPATQGAFAEAVSEELGWSPEVGRFHLFRVDLDEITFIRYESANGDQFVTRWPGHVEFVRRGTSATSVGPPEPISDLLV
jgi:hypothetical protein